MIFDFDAITQLDIWIGIAFVVVVDENGLLFAKLLEDFFVLLHRIRHILLVGPVININNSICVIEVVIVWNWPVPINLLPNSSFNLYCHYCAILLRNILLVGKGVFFHLQVRLLDER